jgi:hypothetical protein
MKKKMRKFEDGGDVVDETGTSYGTIKRNTETGELYDTEMPKAKPKAESKPAAKTEPKSEEPAKKTAKEQMKEAIKPPKRPKSYEEAGGGKERAKAKAEPGMFSFSKIAKNLRERAGITSYKAGGSASSRADGCAIKGKTKGKMV